MNDEETISDWHRVNNMLKHISSYVEGCEGYKNAPIKTILTFSVDIIKQSDFMTFISPRLLIIEDEK